MLSHELRNPLAAILSATRLIEGAVVADSVRQEAGLVVERQAKHMARLLDDLLDVARITRGRIVLRNERIDLRDTRGPPSKRWGRSWPSTTPIWRSTSPRSRSR